MKGHSFWNSTLIRIIFVVIGVGFGVFLGHRHLQSLAMQEIRTPNGVAQPDATIISPQGVHISVLVADTDNKRVSGLSGFPLLKERQGMLFVFPQVGIYSFWMKDMNFPLDIVWIDENNSIVDRVINALPESYPETFTPHASAARVLELPANTADKYGFTLGAVVKIKNNK